MYSILFAVFRLFTYLIKQHILHLLQKLTYVTDLVYVYFVDAYFL